MTTDSSFCFSACLSALAIKVAVQTLTIIAKKKISLQRRFVVATNTRQASDSAAKSRRSDKQRSHKISLPLVFAFYRLEARLFFIKKQACSRANAFSRLKNFEDLE